MNNRTIVLILLVLAVILLLSACADKKPEYYRVTAGDQTTILRYETYGICIAEGNGLGSLAVRCWDGNRQTYAQTADKFESIYGDRP